MARLGPHAIRELCREIEGSPVAIFFHTTVLKNSKREYMKGHFTMGTNTHMSMYSNSE